jgi:hypothetical protein
MGGLRCINKTTLYPKDRGLFYILYPFSFSSKGGDSHRY